jgi:replicative DNA helicase
MANEFDRKPPQDINAEQSVLGAMLLSQDAIGDVTEIISAADFYKPAHELIFTTIIDLFSKGEPADAVTLVAELSKNNQLAKVGGAPYIHELTETVPTAANASFYAHIVRRMSILNGLVRAGTRIVQMG